MDGKGPGVATVKVVTAELVTGTLDRPVRAGDLRRGKGAAW